MRDVARLFSAIAAIGLSCAASMVSAEQLYVGSWNIVHLGWDNDKDFDATAQVASKFDLLAVQEVMNEDGLRKLEAAIETTTGTDWESFASAAVGRGRYTEHYAFLWRPEKVQWVDGAVTYIDDRDVFEREPFSMRFKTSDGYRFVYATAHSIYGDNVEAREAEAVALRSYLDWLGANFDGDPIYLAGDFNLPPSNAAWQAVGEIASPAVTSGATTLSEKNGIYASLYDQVWMPSERPVPVIGFGKYDYPKSLGMHHSVARKTVSDHAPVFIVLDPEAPVWTEFPDHAPTDAPAAIAKVTPTKAAAVGAGIKGNKNSKIYHLAHCPSYGKVSERNIQWFTSEAEATGAGYRIAKNCD